MEGGGSQAETSRASMGADVREESECSLGGRLQPFTLYVAQCLLLAEHLWSMLEQCVVGRHADVNGGNVSFGGESVQA